MTNRDPRTNPQPGDKQHTPHDGTWTVLSVDVETVTLRLADGRECVTSRDTWARVVPGFRWEAAPGVPAQRTPEDARLDPQPGDRYYTHLGARWTVVVVTADTVCYRLDDGRVCTIDIALWSWRRSGGGYRWEAAPPPPVGDACAPSAPWRTVSDGPVCDLVARCATGSGVPCAAA